MTPDPAIQASRTLTKDQLCLLEPAAPPCAIVIFGASGDLAHRKLFPSLFHLFQNNLMPKNFCVIGVARTPMSDKVFRERVGVSLTDTATDDQKKKFVERFFYLSGDYADSGLYQKLKSRMEELDQTFHTSGNRLLYLAVPPTVYSVVVGCLGKVGFGHSPHDKTWTHVVIEKPFGDTLVSAQKLNTDIHRIFHEKQIYRIDHYLGKETVQNILMFRFANILFEPVWNRNYIDHIQITAAEQIGVEHRAGYYEKSGVLRDMFQNHLLQLLALIAMEPPSHMDADQMRSRRGDVIKSIKIFKRDEVAKNTVAAQYGPGVVNGQWVPGYRQEKDVNPASRTPTYAALRLEVDNWRWQGVPFYLRAGKRLASRSVEIAVQFKHVPTSIFKPLLADQLSPNVLCFRIQPNEGIRMSFEAKHPGPKLCMSTVTMNFGYEETFHTPIPESYARLFQDALVGDQTLFARADGVEDSWRVIDPITDYWETEKGPDLPIYSSGSWGPTEADQLLARDGRTWH